MSIAIQAEGIAKIYMLGHQRDEPYLTLRDVLARRARSAIGRVRHPLRRRETKGAVEEFHALRDVSFEIPQGERIGIIGRNGAGKSTLLKVLSRITEPTRGRITLRGRVASLLEVGTGFHPELTGRENIYLNGAILGMNKAEIRRKFDAIIDFAEVEQFLDTPVKRYSSGMYVRLAFAVAAHLEPEILIVDEVLAVGDAQFQRKCLGKMKEVGGEGRTVLFVSHNMNAVEQLCSSAMLLDKGQIAVSSGDVRHVVSVYQSGVDNSAGATCWINSGNEYQNPWFQPLRFAIVDAAGEVIGGPVRSDQELYVQIEGRCERYDADLQVGYALYTEQDQLLYFTCDKDGPRSQWVPLSRGTWTLRSKFPRRLVNEGRYHLELFSARYCREWLNRPGFNSPSIAIEIAGGLSDSPYFVSRDLGILAPVLEWTAYPSESEPELDIGRRINSLATTTVDGAES